MKIIDNFTSKEMDMLKIIDIKIEDREYTIEEVNNLYEFVYKNGFLRLSFTYKDAEEYRKLAEKIKLFSKVDIEKLKQYSKSEFDDEFYFSTILMHSVIWNSPERINNHIRNSNQKQLNLMEYINYEKKQRNI